MKVMDLLFEVAMENKPMLGSGMSKDVYYSKHNPDIVYKVSYLEWLEYEEEIFNRYPDLFCKVYGKPKKMSKTVMGTTGWGTPLRSDVYYLAYERLDTNRFKKFIDRIEEIFRSSEEILKLLNMDGSGKISYISQCLLMLDKHPNLLNMMKPLVKEKAPELYNDYLMYINLIHKLNKIEEPESTWDFNSGNFGYDKKGRIKSLDI